MKALDGYECEQQISFINDRGNMKAHLPETNITRETRAKSNEVVDKEKRYRQIVEILSEGQSIKLTAKQIAVIMCRKGWIPTEERNFTAPRLTELTQAGIVEPCGKTRCLYTGKTVTVYRLRRA